MYGLQTSIPGSNAGGASKILRKPHHLFVRRTKVCTQSVSNCAPVDAGRRCKSLIQRREPRPEHSVCRRQSETCAARAIDHRELMAESEDLEMQRRA